MINSERLQLTRQAMSLDIDGLAAKSGLPAPDLIQYELGTGKAATDDAVQALATALGVPANFLTRARAVTKIISMSPHTGVLNGIQRDALIAQTRLWLDRYFDIESLIDEEEIPQLDLPEGWPLTVTTPADAARAADSLRQAFGWGDAVIHMLSPMLTDVGFCVGEVNVSDQFSAAAFYTDDGLGRPVIVMQHTLNGGEQRFAMARELAYLVLDKLEPPLAPHFAGAFLATARGLRHDVGLRRTQLDQTELAFVKHKYSVPVHRLIPRLATLGIIDQDYMADWLELGREEGWDVVEREIGGALEPERPQRMIRLAYRLAAEGELSEGLSQALLDMPWLKS